MDTTPTIPTSPTKFPAWVASHEGYEFRLDRPFKNHSGTYTVMVQGPNGGRIPVRHRLRSQAIDNAVRVGHDYVAESIRRGYLG